MVPRNLRKKKFGVEKKSLGLEAFAEPCARVPRNLRKKAGESEKEKIGVSARRDRAEPCAVV